MPSPAKFVQITCTARSNVFALDEDGNVWHYIPFRPGKENGGKGRFAFWSKMTSYRRDPAQKKLEHEGKDCDSSCEH